jgi:hypothetical protein
MKLLQKRPWRWLRWLIAGLLSAVVFASLPSIWQSASATTNSNQVDPALQQMDAQSYSACAAAINLCRHRGDSSRTELLRLKS